MLVDSHLQIRDGSFKGVSGYNFGESGKPLELKVLNDAKSAGRGHVRQCPLRQVAGSF